jgi:hypothetical protein
MRARQWIYIFFDMWQGPENKWLAQLLWDLNAAFL